MAQRIRATRFLKRVNSLNVPRTWTREFNCALKEDCSWDYPVFLLKTDDFQENYVNWGQWYYYVTDVIFKRNELTEVHCKIDSLATFRWHILESSQFVAYADIANTELIDPRLSIKTTTTRAVNTSSGAWDLITPDEAQMTAVLNVVGETSSTTYLTTVNNAKNLLNSVKNWADGIFQDIPSSTSGLPELVELLKRFCSRSLSASSAADCLKSACILPVKYSLIAGNSNSIMLGGYDTHIMGKIPTRRSLTDSNGVNIPWQAADWRRNAPYHSIYCYVPFVGVVSLSASELINAEGIFCTIGVDVTNGDATIKLSTLSTGDHVIAVYNTNISISYMIGASNVTPLQRLTGGAAVVGGATAAILSGGAVAAAAAGTGGIVGSMNSIQPIPSSIGNPGGGAVLGLGWNAFKLQCLTVFHDTIVHPSYNSRIIGQPFMRIAKLDNLNGYVECRNAHIGINGHYNEAKEIESYLNTGIYIEGGHND